MHFYQRDPSDPDWLSAAGQFHGHLGPYVTVGTMIGRDAKQRLATRGHWELEVVCWLPPCRQRQPYSCILDGLQVGSGATMGKQNIRLAYSPKVVPNEWPVVHVIRRPADNQPAEGLAYHLKPMLIDILSHITPDRLERTSRDIAKHSIDELFEVRPLTADELEQSRSPETK